MENIKLIKSPEDFDAFWYYRNSTHVPSRKPDKYPQKYPCFARHVHEDGGIGGEYVSHEVCYIPSEAKDLDHVSCFEAGLKAEWILIT